MAIGAKYKIARGLRAAFTALKSGSSLVIGLPYLITDEGRLAVALTTSTAAEMATKAEVDSKADAAATTSALAAKADAAATTAALGLRVLQDSATGAAKMPSGTTAQRPGAPAVGWTRFNTTLGYSEIWEGAAWNKYQGPAGAAGAPGSFDIYTGTSYAETIYPIGHILLCYGAQVSPNAIVTPYVPTTSNPIIRMGTYGGTVAAAGTWRSRGVNGATTETLAQRVA